MRKIFYLQYLGTDTSDAPDQSRLTCLYPRTILTIFYDIVKYEADLKCEHRYFKKCISGVFRNNFHLVRNTWVFFATEQKMQPQVYRKKVYPVAKKKKRRYISCNLSKLTSLFTSLVSSLKNSTRYIYDTRLFLIPRDLRGLLVAGDVLKVDPIVLQTARIVVVRVIVIVLLARFRPRCRATAAAR